MEKIKELFKDKRVLAGTIAAAVVLLIIIISIIVVVAGGKKEEPVIETETEEEVIPEETETEETREGMLKSALTGLWVDEAIAKNRPVAIMIENTYGTLPQYGISYADVIYELPVEGGITRLMGVFQTYDGMERIGNVRSARKDYLYFARELDAVYYHCGESYLAIDMLNAGFVDDVDGITGPGGNYYYRIEDEAGREAPHNLYTSSDLLHQAISDLGYRTEIDKEVYKHFNFAKEDKDLLKEGEDAKVVDIYYANNYPHFIYDEETQTYARFEFDEEQKDIVTDQQLKVSNIILCEIPCGYDENTVVLMNPIAEGPGKFYSQGKVIDITWKKESDIGATKYYDTLGNEIVMTPGKTWICLQDIVNTEKNSFYASVEDFENK